MKKILFFLMLAGAMVVYGQTDQPLTSLPTATDPDADDVTYIVEDGVSKKLTMGQIASYVADSGYVSD
jgi:glycerol-3-phosphate dehydrogenase